MNYVTFTSPNTAYLSFGGYFYDRLEYVFLSSTNNTTFPYVCSIEYFTDNRTLSSSIPPISGYPYTNYFIQGENKLVIYLSNLPAPGLYDIIVGNAAGYSKLSDKNYLINMPAPAVATFFYDDSTTSTSSDTEITQASYNRSKTLTAVILSVGVTSIGDQAFFNCTSLSAITISNTVTNIGVLAFYYCSSLLSITFPDSVTYIGHAALSGCNGMNVYFLGNAPALESSLGSSGVTVYYCEGATGFTDPFGGAPAIAIACDAPACIAGWTYTNFQGTTFRNGDTIPQITDQAEWNAATGPAWCYYDNDAANDAIYGKLYNRHAVIDVRGLAPEGFHVPTLAEWQDLIVCLGGSDAGGGIWPVAGAKMKTTGTIQDADGLWNTPNVATNESLFSVEPAGCRTSAFINLHARGSFWVNDQSVCINFNNAPSYVYIGGDSDYVGYSVRLKAD